MGKKIRCNRCGEAFITEKGLKQHMKEKHYGYYLIKRTIPILVLSGIILIALLLFFPQQTTNPNLNLTTIGLGSESSGEERIRVEEGSIAPNFRAISIDGKGISLHDFRGKTVILWFMAVWCPSCSVVGPIIRNNQKMDTVVIVIDMWTEKNLEEAGLLNRVDIPPPEDEDDLISFISKYGRKDWILILDNFGLTKLYQLRYVDTTFVIDEEGKIILRSDGPVSSSLLKYALDKV